MSKRYLKGGLCIVLLCLFIAADLAYAQTIKDPLAKGYVGPPAIQESSPAPDGYGTVISIQWLPFNAFLPTASDTTWAYATNGYYYRTGGTNTAFSAPLLLNTGVQITAFAAHFYDNSSSDINISLVRYYNATTPGTEVIDTWSVTGSGYLNQYHALATPHTFNPSSTQSFYHLVINLPDATTNLQIKGIKVYYQLQVSPAPANATFDDVPVSHMFFSYIEALASSGITAGCTATQYCPDSYVTRAQMAKYLAVGLGLNWGL